ncbi:MAG TPA: protease HtpX [Burkholderiaceae bacterium]|nr:protease HtpX [Burkholderiaceae bacterium]
MKRVALFLATNIAIILVLSVTLRILGVEPYLTDQGIALGPLLIFAAVFGMGGAFISLLLSKWTAKRAMGVHVIEQPTSQAEHWLIDTVRRQANMAGIGMPEVGIFDSPQPNAFATGANRNNALVAVSTGLMRTMDQREVEAVLAHEVSHVANGDMVTLTLIQGVVNTFVIFAARVIGHTVDRVVFKNERGYGPGFFISYIAAELILGILATIIVLWFSRQREFRADAGGARLAGREAMVAALQRLKRSAEGEQLPERMAAFGITGRTTGGLKRLFMTHPPLDERIEALQRATTR